MRRVILDTETTGLGPLDRVIEIGCVEMRERTLTGRQWHCYLNPHRGIDPDAQKVHGIEDTDLLTRVDFSEVAEDLLLFLSGAEVIAHNAEFDVKMLDKELRHAGREESIRDIATVVDTLKMAREKHPGQRNGLDALCKRYNIDATVRTVHGALVDAIVLSNVYLAMTRKQGKLELEADNPEVMKYVRPDNLKLIVVQATSEELAAQDALAEKNPKLKEGPARLLMGERDGGCSRPGPPEP